MRDLTWRTDEPCPLCGTGLFLLEGLDSLYAECRLCGFAVTLASDHNVTEGW